MCRDMIFGRTFNLVYHTADNIFDDTTVVMVYSLDRPDKIARKTFKKRRPIRRIRYAVDGIPDCNL